MNIFETTAYILRYWFVFVIVTILLGIIIVSFSEYAEKKRTQKLNLPAEYIAKSSGIIIFLIVLFVMSAFTLLFFRGDNPDFSALALGLGICLIIVLIYNILKRIYINLDKFTFIIPMLLSAIGLIVQYRLNPEIGVKQFIWFAIGLFAMVIVIEVIRRSNNFGKLNILFILLCTGLLISTLIFSRTIGGAKNWIEIAGFSFQPSEFAKILFIMVSAYYFSSKKRAIEFIPYLIFCAVCVLTLVVARDLGGAILFALTFIVLLYAASGNKVLALSGLGVLGVGAVFSYNVFSHVKVRVDIWQNPWITYQDSGYQIVQGLMAMASGSFLGMGLNLGYPSAIPAARTDFVFAVVCEEFGIVFGIALIAFYFIFILRGSLIAISATDKYSQLLVFGATAMLCLQCFIIIGGVIKLIPLTGITLPFISYGGSSMLSCMMLVGIMEGVAIKSADKRKYFEETGL